jgi:hypothetical protein
MRFYRLLLLQISEAVQPHDHASKSFSDAARSAHTAARKAFGKRLAQSHFLVELAAHLKRLESNNQALQQGQLLELSVTTSL